MHRTLYPQNIQTHAFHLFFLHFCDIWFKILLLFCEVWCWSAFVKSKIHCKHIEPLNILLELQPNCLPCIFVMSVSKSVKPFRKFAFFLHFEALSTFIKSNMHYMHVETLSELPSIYFPYIFVMSVFKSCLMFPKKLSFLYFEAWSASARSSMHCKHMEKLNIVSVLGTAIHLFYLDFYDVCFKIFQKVVFYFLHFEAWSAFVNSSMRSKRIETLNILSKPRSNSFPQNLVWCLFQNLSTFVRIFTLFFCILKLNMHVWSLTCTANT